MALPLDTISSDTLTVKIREILRIIFKRQTTRDNNFISGNILKFLIEFNEKLIKFSKDNAIGAEGTNLVRDTLNDYHPILKIFYENRVQSVYEESSLELGAYDQSENLKIFEEHYNSTTNRQNF